MLQLLYFLFLLTLFFIVAIVFVSVDVADSLLRVVVLYDAVSLIVPVVVATLNIAASLIIVVVLEYNLFL